VPCVIPPPFLNLFLLAGSCFDDGIDASVCCVIRATAFVCVPVPHWGFVAGRKSRSRNVWTTTSSLSICFRYVWISWQGQLLIGLKLDKVKNQFRLEMRKFGDVWKV